MDFSDLKPATADSEKPTVSNTEISKELEQLPVVLPVKSLTNKIIDAVVIEDAHREVAKEQADSFDLLDTNSVLTFAIKPQQEYTQSLKKLLGDSKVRNLGYGAQIVKQIKSGLEIAEVDKMQKELQKSSNKKSLLQQLPFVNKITSAFSNWDTKRQKLQSMVEIIEEDIQSQMDTLIKENAKMDVLMQEVRTNFYQLGVYLYAGEQIVERGANEYAQLREKAQITGDALLISDLIHLKGQMQSFDARLLEIKKAYVSAPLEIQSILTIQQASRVEMQNQMNSLLFTVPKLIKSLVRLVSLFNIKNAQDVRDKNKELEQQLDQLSGQTLEHVATNAQQALVDAAEEANRIEQQANETLALAEKLNEGSKEIKEAQDSAETKLKQVMDNFQKSLLEVQTKDL